MTTRLEYLLGMGNNRSNWLLNSNPSLTYMLVKDSSLMYLEPSVKPLNRFFSTTNLTGECDDCFKKAAKDFEDKLKLLNDLSDAWVDDFNASMDDVGLQALHDFIQIFFPTDAIIGLGNIIVAYWAAILPEVQYLDPALAGKLTKEMGEALGVVDFPGINKGIDAPLPMRVAKADKLAKEIANATKESGIYLQQAVESAHFGTGSVSSNLHASQMRDLIANTMRMRMSGLNVPNTPASLTNYVNSPKITPATRTVLQNLSLILRNHPDPFYALLRTLGRFFKIIIKVLGVITALVSVYQLVDLYLAFVKKVQDLCNDHRNKQLDIIAQKYLAADKYFNDMGKCYQAGCCDDEIDCKGLGGWCTRIRDGVDFTFYTHCCDTCDCGGDNSCIKAFCSSCDPSAPCSNTGTDNTDDTQTGSGTESLLPNYLFQLSLTAKPACPPLPSGWKRHPNDKDPDPRSSPLWDVEPWPPCDGPLGSGLVDYAQEIFDFWRGIFGSNTGGGSTTTAN
jgi:hypothetical protein